MSALERRAFSWQLLVPAWCLLLVVGAVGVWWLSRENCRLVLVSHRGAVRAEAFSADGRLLATGGSDQTVHLWELPGGNRRGTIKSKGGFVFALAFSPDASLLAVGSNDGSLQVFDSNAGTQRFAKSAHRNGVHALLFTPDGQTIISAGADKHIRLWDVAGSKERRAFRQHSATVYALALSADGKTLASGAGDNLVYLYNMDNIFLQYILKGHRQRIHALAFAGSLLASGDREGTVKVWNAAGREQSSFSAHEDRIVGLGGQGNRLISCCENGGLAAWSLSPTPGTPTRWKQRGPAVALAISPDGQVVAVASGDGRVRVWEVPR